MVDCVVCGEAVEPVKQPHVHVTCSSSVHVYCDLCALALIRAEHDLPSQSLARVPPYSFSYSCQRAHGGLAASECSLTLRQVVLSSNQPLLDEFEEYHARAIISLSAISASVAAPAISSLPTAAAAAAPSSDTTQSLHDRFVVELSSCSIVPTQQEIEKLQVWVRTHILPEIQTTVLNLHCPQCHQIYDSHDGCDAITCPHCATAFCAVCLHTCGIDAHNHVQTFHGKLFSTAEEVKRHTVALLGEQLAVFASRSLRHPLLVLLTLHEIVDHLGTLDIYPLTHLSIEQRLPVYVFTSRSDEVVTWHQIHLILASTPTLRARAHFLMLFVPWYSADALHSPFRVLLQLLDTFTSNVMLNFMSKLFQRASVLNGLPLSKVLHPKQLQQLITQIEVVATHADNLPHIYLLTQRAFAWVRFWDACARSNKIVPPIMRAYEEQLTFLLHPVRWLRAIDTSHNELETALALHRANGVVSTWRSGRASPRLSTDQFYQLLSRMWCERFLPALELAADKILVANWIEDASLLLLIKRLADAYASVWVKPDYQSRVIVYSFPASSVPAERSAWYNQASVVVTQILTLQQGEISVQASTLAVQLLSLICGPQRTDSTNVHTFLHDEFFHSEDAPLHKLLVSLCRPGARAKKHTEHHQAACNILAYTWARVASGCTCIMKLPWFEDGKGKRGGGTQREARILFTLFKSFSEVSIHYPLALATIEQLVVRLGNLKEAMLLELDGLLLGRMQSNVIVQTIDCLMNMSRLRSIVCKELIDCPWDWQGPRSRLIDIVNVLVRASQRVLPADTYTDVYRSIVRRLMERYTRRLSAEDAMAVLLFVANLLRAPTCMTENQLQEVLLCFTCIVREGGYAPNMHFICKEFGFALAPTTTAADASAIASEAPPPLKSALVLSEQIKAHEAAWALLSRLCETSAYAFSSLSDAMRAHIETFTYEMMERLQVAHVDSLGSLPPTQLRHCVYAFQFLHRQVTRCSSQAALLFCARIVCDAPYSTGLPAHVQLHAVNRALAILTNANQSNHDISCLFQARPIWVAVLLERWYTTLMVKQVTNVEQQHLGTLICALFDCPAQEMATMLRHTQPIVHKCLTQDIPSSRSSLLIDFTAKLKRVVESAGHHTILNPQETFAFYVSHVANYVSHVWNKNTFPGTIKRDHGNYFRSIVLYELSCAKRAILQLTTQEKRQICAAYGFFGLSAICPGVCSIAPLTAAMLHTIDPADEPLLDQVFELQQLFDASLMLLLPKIEQQDLCATQRFVCAMTTFLTDSCAEYRGYGGSSMERTTVVVTWLYMALTDAPHTLLLTPHDIDHVITSALSLQEVVCSKYKSLALVRLLHACTPLGNRIFHDASWTQSTLCRVLDRIVWHPEIVRVVSELIHIISAMPHLTSLASTLSSRYSMLRVSSTNSSTTSAVCEILVSLLPAAAAASVGAAANASASIDASSSSTSASASASDVAASVPKHARAESPIVIDEDETDDDDDIPPPHSKRARLL
jgi:hypothetical protein